MALTTDPWDSTELVAYINEVWTPITLEEYFANAVAANFFTDLTQYASQGGDIFHIPDVFTNAFSVQSQSTQGAEVTTEAPATVDVTLTVDTHKYIATLLGYKDQVQIANIYNINEIYARKAGGTLMHDFEDAIFALWSDISTNTIGDTATVINDSEIRQSLEKLATANVPIQESAFFFHPYSYYLQIIAIQKYYDASQAGWKPGTALTITGNFGVTSGLDQAHRGRLFGVDVFTSQRVVNTLLAVRNLLAHKSAFAFAHQTPGGQRVRFQSANWLENLGILSVWDTIYGVKTTREDVAVLINGSNAFIAS
jgi:hypothetical protein